MTAGFRCNRRAQGAGTAWSDRGGRCLARGGSVLRWFFLYCEVTYPAYNTAMECEYAIARLKAHEAELRRLGVEHLYLFGSTMRGEAREDSDVDLFFDHPEGSLGLYELMDVKAAASRILGREADIMTRRSLHPVLRAGIKASARRVF